MVALDRYASGIYGLTLHALVRDGSGISTLYVLTSLALGCQLLDIPHGPGYRRDALPEIAYVCQSRRSRI